MEKSYSSSSGAQAYAYKNPALHGFYISLFLRAGSMYENESAATDPGTEMKVTPDIAAPIMASVAAYHDVRLPPMKKEALSAPRPLRRASRNSSAK